MASGFDLYVEHFSRPPSLVVEWHDDATSAVGWLCIDSLRGNAAGGGTRMRTGGTREEAVFLAKTMGVKFRVCGPDIGGGKSVIAFDPTSADKRGVLERWYRHVSPYLRACYGTGGDVGVDEVSDATAAIERVAGLKHPQAGIILGHYASDSEGAVAKIERMRHGVEARVVLEGCPGPRDGAWMVADVATGVGVVRALERYYDRVGQSLAGQRAIIEGFGAVGSFAGYYLERLGVKTVAASTAGPKGVRVVVDPAGLRVNALIEAVHHHHKMLPAAGHPAYGPSAVVTDAASGEALFAAQGEIFIPAARSHTIDRAQIAALRRAGVRVWSCGANNPFSYDPKHPKGYLGWVEQMLELMREADPHFAIIPDFVANSGMARTFAYLMEKGAKPDAASIIRDIRGSMDQAMDRLLGAATSVEKNLLDRGFGVFLR